MPRGDGTGPMGMGPGTGRGAGWCGGCGRPGPWMMPWGGRRGWPGRGMPAPAYPPQTWNAPPVEPRTPAERSPEEECEFLRRNAERLQAELDAIRERLDMLKEEEE